MNATQENVKNLGWMNGWRVPPNVVTICNKNHHKLEIRTNHQRCVSTVTCHKCGYTYKVDSSG